MQIKATATLKDASGKKSKELVEAFDVNIPGTIEGMVKAFSQEVCTEMLKKALVIAYQAFARGKMVKREEGVADTVGIKGPTLQTAVDAYKPTLRKQGKSFFDKVREKAKGMSDDEKRALLAELTGAATTKQATPTRRAATPAVRR